MTEGQVRRTRRLFFALWPEEALRSRIYAGTREAVAQLRCRPVREANLHITLLFLGATPEDRLDVVRQAAQQLHAHAFELTFDQYEIWPKVNVFSLTCSRIPDALTDLHRDLRGGLTSCGFTIKEQEYRPHITLARDVARARRSRRPAEALSWPVSEFMLVDSNMTKTGSKYTLLERWRLQS